MSNIPAIWLALIIAIATVAYVLRPFLLPEGGSQRKARKDAHLHLIERQVELSQRRMDVYDAMKELDFDYSVDKLVEADYARQRYTLMAEAISIANELDQIAAEIASTDPLEALIRGGQMPANMAEAPAAASGARVCPQCGEHVQPADRFCGACGANLMKEGVAHAAQ